MNKPAQKCAGRKHNGAGRNLAGVRRFDTSNPAVLEDQVVGFGLDDLEVWNSADRGLHRNRVKLAVGLGTWATHSGSLAAVQDPELDSAKVRDATHETVKRIDFPHQMTLAQPANGGIARHRSNSCGPMGTQSRAGTLAGGRSRGFTAGVAASNHHDVESVGHRYLGRRGFSGCPRRGQNHPFPPNVSRETPGSIDQGAGMKAGPVSLTYQCRNREK